MINTVKKQRLKTLAEIAFEQAEPSSDYLSVEVLRALDAQYPPRAPIPPRGTQADNAGDRRAAEVLHATTGRTWKELPQFLEIGAGEAMVGYSLQRAGMDVTAIDLESVFDIRARNSGMACLQMDAQDLEFEDHSFDCVYSYDVFEHVRDPKRTLGELIRVVRPGGLIFLSFGPLFNSATGLHSHRTLAVPYRQYLFSTTMLQEFAKVNQRAPINLKHVNRWSLKQFRELWKSKEDELIIVNYREELNLSHLNLVVEHPSRFRSKVDFFDELIVSRIDTLFQKMT